MTEIQRQTLLIPDVYGLHNRGSKRYANDHLYKKGQSFCYLKVKMILNGATDTRNELSTPKIVGLYVKQVKIVS